MIIYWIALSVSFLMTAIGQVVYKLFAETHNKWHFIAAVSAFMVAPFTSFIALHGIDAGMVYIGAASSQVLILILSKYILLEEVSKDHVIAMGLILIGLITYAL